MLMARTFVRKGPMPSVGAWSEVDKAFIYGVMFELGIAPIENASNDLRKSLKALDRETSRVMKRKFRKLWRKYVKAQLSQGKNQAQTKANVIRDRTLKQKYGLGNVNPTNAQRFQRKLLVSERIWSDIIVPMLMKVENPDRQPVPVGRPDES